MIRHTQRLTGLLVLVFGFVGTYSESIIGDRPFLSFTNEKSNIGVEIGFSIPLMKVPVEVRKQPNDGGHLLSAPIEVNLPALAIAATMFVASAAFIPKVFQLLWPVMRPPVTTENYWRSDNISTASEHWKSLFDLDNIDKTPAGDDIPVALGFNASRPRFTSRKLSKHFPKPHRFPYNCESVCNRTSSRTNIDIRPSKNIPKTEADPK